MPAATIAYMQSLLQDGSVGLLSRAKACTAAGSLHTMDLSIAPHSADDHLSGVPDSLLKGTSGDVHLLLFVPDSVFITTGATAGLVAWLTPILVLQRDLGDARGALQKQWRELSASFEDQLRHLELECNTKLEQATEQMKLATQQAAERESEASEAHSKERAAADAAAVRPPAPWLDNNKLIAC